MKSRLIKKTDIIVSLVLLCAGVLVFVLLGKGDGRTAVIEYNGKTVKEIDLDSVKDEYSFTFDGDVSVEFTVNKDGIRFSASGCPDGICMDFGAISKPGQTAICAVAKVSVRIVGSSQTVDGVTG